MSDSVFKYLPEQYLDSLLQGKILFRNLVYFKKIEADPRKDASEGTHIDSPDHDVELTSIRTGQRIIGNFAFHNSVANPDKVFCFCTSQQCRPELTKFGNGCIEIHDRRAFESRLIKALRRRSKLSRLDHPLLIADAIKYYSKDKLAPQSVDIKNPKHLPFLKEERYSNEAEFRFVFALRGGYELRQSIVNQDYDESDEIKDKSVRAITIKIGSIADIARRVAS